MIKKEEFEKYVNENYRNIFDFDMVIHDIDGKIDILISKELPDGVVINSGQYETYDECYSDFHRLFVDYLKRFYAEINSGRYELHVKSEAN